MTCCKGTLRNYGVDNNAIESVEKMINYVRLEAIGNPMLINFNQAFIVMQFSKKDENDRAYEYGIFPALDNLGIEYCRSDDQIISQQILNQIVNSIKRSRYVIVKVDNDNLNVYFELGLALGIGKEILLISEIGKIENLPTDLNNFECLTYEKGNYEELKQKIIKFFKDNYHYLLEIKFLVMQLNILKIQYLIMERLHYVELYNYCYFNNFANYVYFKYDKFKKRQGKGKGSNFRNKSKLLQWFKICYS